MIRFLFVLIFITNQVSALELKGTFEQGSLIIGKTNPSNEIYVDQKKLKVSKEGYFIFGISRDRKKNIIISINKDNKAREVIKVVKSRKFKVQKIDGLPKRKVSPNDEDMKRIRKEGKLIAKAKNVNSDLSFFFKDFIRPVDGITTGVFGSQRVLNGKPRRPHYGIDFHAPEGTPVKAMMDGEVTLAENDMYFTGGTIIFDHGHGISTLYMHMKDIDVKVGQKIKQGQIVGTLGQSGRATGPHLDIRLNWFDVKLDPATILNSN